jgi:signal transduction histidine kinase
MNMPWTPSLRSRLTAWYAAVLVIALAVFGAIAVLVIDRNLHASLDARLNTTARAALNFVDLKHGYIELDERDRAQLLALAGSQTELAIVNGLGSLVYATTARPFPDLVASTSGRGAFYTLPHAGTEVRALVVPIRTPNSRLGAVIVWAATGWIADTDRQVAAAFALAALVLCAVAILAGTMVTRRALEDTFLRQRRFTTDASHELRAPLSVIRAEADLALRRPRGEDSYQRSLATIAAEAERMEQLVNSLLSAARGGDESNSRGIVDLRLLAEMVCTRLQPAAVVKQICIALDGQAECPARGDSEAIQRAITAVVHNAIKHTPVGGTISVRAERRRNSSELSVHDSGQGFSSEALVHGLEWFWRGNQAESEVATGLGLAIAASIARASGGRVTLSNDPGGGANVVISLPRS